jgi:NOL1/NOP2/fmu family ribosome biogenesis protein
MNPRFIKSSQKREIESQLNENFGIEKLNYLLVESGKEKIRAFSTHLSKDEIDELCQIINVETIGAYLLKQEPPIIRLSFDACHILSNQIEKGVIELDENQAEEWMLGKDIPLKAEKGVFVVKHKEYFLGCGKSNSQVLFNHVPKDRRTRNHIIFKKINKND